MRRVERERRTAAEGKRKRVIVNGNKRTKFGDGCVWRKRLFTESKWHIGVPFGLPLAVLYIERLKAHQNLATYTPAILPCPSAFPAQID